MSKFNLGKVALTPKGEWSASTAYERLDVVSHEGSSYTVLKECKGVTPVEGEYYSLLAMRGEDGLDGAPGQDGKDGKDGTPGEKGDPGQGFSSGGSTGQVLVKQSETDYDTAWKTLSSLDIGAANNQNLIINNDFRKAVNRNGKTEYGSGCTIDMWYLQNSGIRLYVHDDYISIHGDNSAWWKTFGQTLSGFSDPIQVTASIIYRSTSQPSFFYYDNYLPVSEDWNLASVTFTLQPNSNGVVQLGLIHAYSERSIDLKAVKLEIGPNQTLARQNENGEWELIDPPNYDLQYLLCSLYNPLTREWIGIQHSNRNLLDNAYWASKNAIVNQRGQNEYTAFGYTIDRWYNRDIGTIQITDNGLVFNCNSDNSYKAFNQRLEFPEEFFGKTVTISVLIEENTLNVEFKPMFVRANSVGLNSNTFLQAVVKPGGVGLFSATGQFVDSLSDYTGVNFSLWFGSATGTLKVKAVKLELGPVQTLAHQDADGNWVLNDPPPDYATELAKCQRYQVVYDLTSEYCGNMIGFIHSAGLFLYGYIRLPVFLRKKPTMVIEGTIIGVRYKVTMVHNVQNLEVWNWTGNSVTFKAILDEITSDMTGEPFVIETRNPIAKIIIDANM